MSHTVLIVDDEPQILLSASTMLRAAGINDVHTIEDSRKVLSFLSAQEIAVVLLDLSMPYMHGTALLVKIKDEFPQIPVIIMTATNELDTAIECIKTGAFDYLVKPVEKNRFLSSIKNALHIYNALKEMDSLRQHLFTSGIDNKDAFSSFITNDRKMHAIFRYIEVIAEGKQPVLITGETGVGKELVAILTHNMSGCKGPFVAVNTSGLDDTMFSDTIFGHRKGAYSGAEQAREGLILKASEGTLFLDEIGDLSLPSQVKLLHLMQDGMFYQLGSDLPARCSARIIAATNRDLNKLISSGVFRKDLYYRLRYHHIHIPPLRERPSDIPLLVEHFLEEAAKSLGKKKPFAPPELLTLLSAYHFPGNIRELKAMVFDAVIRHKSGILSMDSFKDVIKEEHIPPSSAGFLSAAADENLLQDIFGHFPKLKETEAFLIEKALKLSKGNQGIAASLLGITRQALNRRINRNIKSSKLVTLE